MECGYFVNPKVWLFYKEVIFSMMINRLEEETGLELKDKVLPELGFCNQTNTWSPGIFAQGTEGQNRDVIIDKLKEGGLTHQKAEKVRF